jgi:predicted AlkP superfamily pyrophosphatase or phosphodiesterase
MQTRFRTFVKGATATVAAVCLLAYSRGSQPATAAPAPFPKLVVLIVVDQMRADYVDRYKRDWTGGLKRLVTDGARFTNAAYPYLETYTCSGHATVATGAFPRTHGIIQNTWYDRGRGQAIECTDDGISKTIVYTGRGHDAGPGLLKLPTLADELRTQRASRVVSMSLKARSAIMLAGHGGDAITWFNESLDGWETSTAYAAAIVPPVKAFLDAHPLEADYGKVWNRLLPVSRYSEMDDVPGENPPDGWTRTFPHPLLSKTDSPDLQFRRLWQHSPFANAYVTAMATDLSERLQLGDRGTTDVLAVAYSTTDLVGHRFGPYSQEVRDLYAHLDRAVGELFDRLDARLGRGRYVVALTADHGVGDIPEQLLARGLSGGRMVSADLVGVAERAAAAVLGPGQYVARLVSNDLYFRPGVYDRLRERPGGVDAVIKALASQDGIDTVLKADDLAQGPAPSDSLSQAAALSFVPERNGDLILVVRSGWMFAANGTTHGSVNAYDRQIPLILMGQGIKPGTYPQGATPADLAPTLASLTGVRLPQAEGHVLEAALRRTSKESATR